MYATLLAAATLAISGVCSAAPSREAASSTTQVDIINLENSLVNLIDYVLVTNPSKAQSVYNRTNVLFEKLGPLVLTPSNYACPPSGAEGRPTAPSEIIQFLGWSQSDLASVSTALRSSRYNATTVNDNYCNAYSSFQFTEYYIFAVMGKNGQIKSNTAGNAEQASLIGCSALISALELIPNGKHATPQAKTAFEQLGDLIENFTTDVSPPVGSCEPTPPGGASTPQTAIEGVHHLAAAVKKLYHDVITHDENNEHEQDCAIGQWQSYVGNYA